MFEKIASWLAGRRPENLGAVERDPSKPTSGCVYSFATSPLSEFATPVTGRFAAFKILGTNSQIIVVAVLDGIWQSRPKLSAVCGASILRMNRFAHNDRQAVFGVRADWWTLSDLTDTAFLGRCPLSAEERKLATASLSFAIGTSISTLRAANHDAEGEWRWKNDREAFVAESEKTRAKAEAARALQEERYRTRLGRLTWDQLLSETPFERWSESPPFPPPEFTEAARAAIRAACGKLQKLGDNPRKAEARKILKECVEWFNSADEAAGGVIETEEREDICAVLEELAFVAKQKRLVDEVDEWRTW